MEHDYSVDPAENFRSNETLEKVKSCFSGRNIQNEHSNSISSKLSLIPLLGLRDCFPVNGTDLYKW